MGFGIARTSVATLAFAGSLMAGSAAWAQGQCSRQSLDDVAARYAEGQKQGSIFTLPVGEWVDYRENGELVSTATGVISQPSEFAWMLDVVDMKACRVAAIGVILKPTPYVVETRLGFTFNGLGRIESTVLKQGDAQFDAQKTFEYASKVDWGDIPADKRDSRDKLVAVANAYLDQLGGSSGELSLAPGCDRIDNGAPGTDCKPAAGPALVDREITVDEAKGAVAVHSSRGESDGPPDVRVFRIEGGQIRHVLAMVPSSK